MQARAVGAERHRDAAPPQLDDRGQARAELEVRARAVQDLDVVPGEQGDVGVVDPDAVGEAQARRGEPDLVQVFDVAEPGQGPHQRHFVALLGGVGVDEQAGVGGESGGTFEEGARARHREPRGDGRRQPAVRRRRATAAPGRRTPRGRAAPAPAAAPVHPRRRPSGTCRPRRAGRSAPAPRTPRRCRGRSPSSAPSSCRPGAARRQRAGLTLPATEGRVRLRAATPARAARPAAAGRRPSRGTASGRDGRGSG